MALRYRLEFPDHFYERVDALSINVCVARRLSDDDVRTYMRATLDAAGSTPTTVSLSAFLYVLPSARQRRIMARAMNDRGLAGNRRAALVTDSVPLRAAMKVLSWLTHLESQSFAPDDHPAALAWLRESGDFDLEVAQAATRSLLLRAGMLLPPPD